MKVHFRKYEIDDFQRVREFLVDSFPRFAPPRNWLIDRWNFVSEAGRIMNRLSESQWAAGIGLWEDSGRIFAMANEEEGKGDVFLQFASPEVMTESLVREMLSFADACCIRPRKGGPGYMLRVPQGDGLLARLAAEQGLLKTSWSEPLSARPIPDEAARPLPGGYVILDGKSLAPSAKALAHSRAFGYAFDNEADFANGRLAFDRVRSTPDYREELDMAIAGPQGDVVSFATVWLDVKNALCVLEPVGTAPEHRRKGLAEILIAEGCRRAAAYGARTAYVGSDQPFYLKIGFRVICRSALWEQKAGKAAGFGPAC